ncbi:MAG: insulinase family protein [Bacteroidetes bacterium]|nr:insulinase family protein [Bacteroidota bacterium]MBS1974551.1 insulinase family protein [Bacteroidota bacterium]
MNRKIAPQIKNAVDFHLELPPYEKYVLKNGIEVYALNIGELDTLMVNFVFAAGNWFEEKNLVAATVNHLLKNGTSAKTAFQVNEHFEYYGSSLSRSCQNETAEIALHCLSKHADQLLPVIAELITDSVFPEEELDIFKKNSQQRLQVSLKKSDFVAGRLIDSYLFGEKHPYGKYSSLEDYASLQQDEIKNFYQQYYRNGKCVIFVAGKLPKNIIEQLEKYFGALALHVWDNDFKNKQHPAIHAKQKKYNITNDVNGVQGSVRIARNFPNRHHPDFQKAGMLNNIFGGYFGSRLMANVREDKGFTYGIYSYLMNHIQESAWIISTEAGKDVCQATIDEVHKEMKLLREEPINEEELQTARNFMIGSVLGDLDGPFHVAGRWKNIILNDLDKNYFYNGIHIIKTITAEELRELANKYLRPEDFYELVVV